MNTAPGAVDFLVAVALLLVAAAATCAALTRDPVRQSVVLAVLGVCLSLLFLVAQAPDVALSQLAVGSAITPLLILLTVRKVRRGARDPRAAARDAGPPAPAAGSGEVPGGGGQETGGRGQDG